MAEETNNPVYDALNKVKSHFVTMTGEAMNLKGGNPIHGIIGSVYIGAFIAISLTATIYGSILGVIIGALMASYHLLRLIKSMI